MKKINDKWGGIAFIILAGFCFALMTFFVRLSGDLPTMQKVFFRNFVAALVAAFLLSRSEEKFHIKKSSWVSLILRSTFGMLGMICNFYAIDKLNIADANILNKLSPFFAIIASYFILREKANKVEWACVAVAFTGAIFVVKPSFNMDFVYAMIGALGGLGAGIAYTYVRKLGKLGERGNVIVFFFSTFTSLGTLPFMIATYQQMSWEQLMILMGAGVAAAGGQLCITRAYFYAPAKEISVFDYTQVIFAALLGFVFLGQIPDWISVLGYVIIIGSAVFKWMYLKRSTNNS